MLRRSFLKLAALAIAGIKAAPAAAKATPLPLDGDDKTITLAKLYRATLVPDSGFPNVIYLNKDQYEKAFWEVAESDGMIVTDAEFDGEHFYFGKMGVIIALEPRL